MRQPSNDKTYASAWGLAAGLVGSLCCIGPSAAILLGLGASSALLGVSLDRTLALAGGATLLLIGALIASRRARACDLRPAARWRTPAVMLISFALAYGLLGLLLPTLAAHQQDSVASSQPAVYETSSLGSSKQPVAAPPQLHRLTLIVEKMECPPCAATVRTALKRQPTVRTFVAEANNDQVIIDYDSSQISAKRLAALFPANYGVTLISDRAIP